jgi:hypothetical protein
MRDGNADDLDAEERAVRIGHAARRVTTGHLVRRTHRREAGDVHVDGPRILRVGIDRVRVRAAAGLHGRDGARTCGIGDVVDADAQQPLLAHGVLHPLRAAVEATAAILGGEEEQVAIDRGITLLRPARRRAGERRRERIGDVPDLEAAEVPLVEVVPAERQVGVRVGEAARVVRVEQIRLVAVGNELHPLRGDAGVVQAGLEPNARIIRRRGLLRTRRDGDDRNEQRGDRDDAEQRPQDDGGTRASELSIHGDLPC